jgi:hypothetical protein
MQKLFDRPAEGNWVDGWISVKMRLNECKKFKCILRIDVLVPQHFSYVRQVLRVPAFEFG